MGFAIWVFGIILAVAAVFCSILLTGDNLLSLASYKSSIPTLYFVSLSAFISTAAEGFDLVLNRPAGQGEESSKRKLGYSYLGILGVTFILFVIFAKSVIDQKDAKWSPVLLDLVWPFAMIILAVVANGVFKAQVGRISKAGA